MVSHELENNINNLKREIEKIKSSFDLQLSEYMSYKEKESLEFKNLQDDIISGIKILTELSNNLEFRNNEYSFIKKILKDIYFRESNFELRYIYNEKNFLIIALYLIQKKINFHSINNFDFIVSRWRNYDKITYKDIEIFNIRDYI